MTLLYCGRFDIGGRDPMPLLKALRQLVEERLPIRLSMIGDHEPGLLSLIAKLNLKDHVQLSGQVSHKAAVQSMADCDVLVLYQEPNQARITPIAGKTYEYLRAGKAILAILPPGDNLAIIRQYAARHETANTHDAHGIAQAIRALYRDWEQGALASHMPPHVEYLRQYSRQVLTARLASHFNRLMAQD